MRNFRYLDKPSFPYFTSIIESKRNTTKGVTNVKKVQLLAMSDSIRERYSHYLGCFSVEQLHNVQDSIFSGFEKQCLLDSYTGNGSALDKLKLEIKNSQDIDWQNKCPYCGILGLDQTDHYIPKDSYSEYAVLSINLVPCCGVCNKKKGEYWKVGAARKIINFYLDRIPNQEFLFCDFSFDDEIPTTTYRLHQSEGIENSIFAMITAHFERLELLGRYKDSSNEEITTTIDSVVSYCRETTAAGVAEDMLTDYGKKIVRFGVNHWRCVLLKSMADSAQLLDYLASTISVIKLEEGLGV